MSNKQAFSLLLFSRLMSAILPVMSMMTSLTPPRYFNFRCIGLIYQIPASPFWQDSSSSLFNEIRIGDIVMMHFTCLINHGKVNWHWITDTLECDGIFVSIFFLHRLDVVIDKRIVFNPIVKKPIQIHIGVLNDRVSKILQYG